MPASPTAPPPSAAPVQPAPSAPSPAPAKSATPAKTVVAPSVSPSKPSKAGVTPPSAKPEPPKSIETLDDAFSGIKKLAGVPDSDLLGEQSAKEQEQPKPDEQNTENAQEDEAQITGKEEVQDKGQDPEADPKLGKRPSPWKLVEHYKEINTNLQREIADLRGKTSEPPKEHTERLTSLEKRNQELEQHMRFLDYSKSQEYVDKYQKPYEEAWARAIVGLKGLQVQFTDPKSGEVIARDLTPQDISALVNMDPAAARIEIKNRFPDDVAEVRGYIDRIRNLADEQHKVLEEQKTKGGDWQKQQQERIKSIHESNNKLWQQYNKEAVEKFDILRPVEGDDERNTKLQKATEFVQKALFAKANDPNMTDEQRSEVIRQHVAVHNRAIAYSVLMHENKQLKAQLAEKEQALKSFEQSSPTDGNGKGKKQSVEGGITVDGVASMLSNLGR